LQRLLRIAQDWQQVELLVIGERSVARLALARGDLGTAQEALQRAEALFEQEEFANNVRWVVDTHVSAAWVTGITRMYPNASCEITRPITNLGDVCSAI